MPLGAEVAGEVAGGRLEARLRDAHPVVDGPRLRVVEVEARRSTRRSPISGSARDGQRLQRVRRHLERDRDVLPRRGEEPAAEARLGREPDRVHHAVEAAADAPARASRCSEFGDIELDDLRLGGQPLGRPLA